MSFRLFIYYCAMGGGCGAYLGWALGRMGSADHHVLQAALKGMYLGMIVALVLGLIDALGNGQASKIARLVSRVGVAVIVGALGGFFGGLLGQALYGFTQLSFFLILGWVVTGTLIGAAPGVFDYLKTLGTAEDSTGPKRKVLRGVIGGAVGGLLGAIFYLILGSAWESVLSGRQGNFWSPSATGFVVLGLCIGLLIGLAQVFLKEAWLRVEEGFRPGRELILAKEETVLGRAEGCDLGLYGDNNVDRLHARIVHKGDRWYLQDLSEGGQTFLNGQRVQGSAALTAGDEIRLGRNRIRFDERRKEKAS